MCKSWFSSSSKKKKAAQAAAAEATAQANEAARKAALGNTEQETATTVQTNKSKDKNISSLRVPLKTQGTGSNVNDDEKKLGLNLLG